MGDTTIPSAGVHTNADMRVAVPSAQPVKDAAVIGNTARQVVTSAPPPPPPPRNITHPLFPSAGRVGNAGSAPQPEVIHAHVEVDNKGTVTVTNVQGRYMVNGQLLFKALEGADREKVVAHFQKIYAHAGMPGKADPVLNGATKDSVLKS
jgi:hypothetical protein